MNDILSIVRKNDKWRRSSINLLPSENMVSPKVLEILGSDLAGRYSYKINDYVHNVYIENAYRGTGYFEQILEYGTKLAKELYESKYIEIRSIGGHIAAMNMLLSTTKKGDLIYAISSENGGYDGYMPNYMPDMFGLKVRFIPYNPKTAKIDYDSFEKELKKYRPKLVILGASYFLFSYDLKRVREMCDTIDCTLGYDGSHVMGLIAGKSFQPEVLKYADILIGSTHKSLFGPQGGIIATNNESIFHNVENNIVWRTMDNYHLNRVAALSQTLLEFKKFGKDYAAQVVKNSKRLAKILDEQGFNIDFAPEYTESHQISYSQNFVNEQLNLSIDEFSKKLEHSNIIIDSVGRLGTNEITRIGIKEKNLDELANLFISSISKNVKKEVIEFRSKFKIRYC